MADSFGVHGMYVAAGPVARDQTADVSIRHIPGGNVTFVDAAGSRARMLTLDLFFAAKGDYDGMELAVGTSDVLTYVDYPSGIEAVLISLVRTGRGLSTTGETMATASFVLLS